MTHGLYTLSALLFVSETIACAAAQTAHLIRVERLTRAKSPHTPLVDENLTELRAERCATRHISGLPQPELRVPCQFRSTRIKREAGANAFEDVAFRQTLRLKRLRLRVGAASRDEAKEWHGR